MNKTKRTHFKKRVTNISKIDMLARAKEFAKRGYLVVPLHHVEDGNCSCGKVDCKHAGKHPMTLHGYKEGTTNPKIIKKWWKKYPKANIGIVTGEGSNLLVIDIDPRNGGNETFAQLESKLGVLPLTTTIITGGGGRHIYFSHPAISKKLPSTLGSGVDLLSNGKIAVARGSVHKSGNAYKFMSERSFSNAPPVPLPESWLVFCTTDVNNSASKKSNYTPSAQDERKLRLMSKAGSLYNENCGLEAAKQVLYTYNMSFNSPPLLNTEVDTLVEELFSDFRNRKSISQSNDPAYAISQYLLKENYCNGDYLLFASNGYFYIYNSKFWEKTTDDRLKKELLKIIVRELNNEGGSKQSFNALVNSSLALLKADCGDVNNNMNPQGEPLPVINCLNGEIWLKPDGEWELRQHNRNSYQKYCLPFDHIPDAECPTYDKALLEIFRETKAPKAMSRHFNELVGYMIQPRRHLPTVVIFIGEGANGKTALMTIIKNLLGVGAVYDCANIIDLQNNRFAIGELFGKLLLVDDDVKQGVKLPDGFLKKISERKSLTGEAKFKPSFNFISLALPVLLCNHVPSISDLSTGMRRRLMVLPFNRTFTDQERDDSVFEHIRANEMSGVLNRALSGMKRVFERKRFNLPKPVKEASQELIRNANPLMSFIHSTYNNNNNGKIALNELYRTYTRWADESGITITLQRNNLKNNLEMLKYKIKHTNTGNVVLGLKPKSR